jgi:hypothetical protein
MHCVCGSHIVLCYCARQEEPATSQLYVLCDMAVATIKALAQRMQLDASLLTAKHPGGITLPVNFYRPLDKEERGERCMRRAVLCCSCAAICGLQQFTAAGSSWVMPILQHCKLRGQLLVTRA